MASTNPLLDDLGIDSPPVSDNPIFADLGISKDSSENTEAPEETSLLDKNKRVAGLGARALTEGAADIADTLAKTGHAIKDIPQWASWEMLKHMRNAFGMEPLPDSPLIHSPLSEFTGGNPAGADIADQAADKAGLPTPATSGERIGSAAVRALPSTLTAGPEGILPSILPTAASGAASQFAKEEGAGPVVQTLAGLAPVAGAAGASALIKGVTRGGAEGAARTAQNLENAQNADINISAGQATGNTALRTMETAGSHVPGGGPLAETRGAGLNHQADESVSNMVEKLSPGASKKPPTPMTAGETMNVGVAKSREQMTVDEGAAYQKVEDLVGKDRPMEAANFAAKAKELAHPTGTPDVDDLLRSPMMLKAEAAGKAAATPAPVSPYNTSWNSVQSQPKPVPPLTFEDLKNMRSKIGQQIDWGMTPSNPGNNSALKQLYGALSEDIKAGVKGVSPEAQKALEEANTLYKTNAGTRELLDRVVDKIGGPEAVFKAATNGTKDGATKIGTVMNQLDEGSKNVVRATVLHRLGRAGGGVDQPFDANTFLNNWRRGLAPEAKDSLFGASGQGNSLRKGLDSLSNTLDLLEKQGYIKSGMATAVGRGTHGIKSLGVMGVVSYLAAHGGSTIAHFAEHHPFVAVSAAGGAAAVLMGNPVMSRVLTNPKTVAWLAQATKAPKASIPVLINQLNQMGQKDPDAKDLAQLIAQESK